MRAHVLGGILGWLEVGDAGMVGAGVFADAGPDLAVGGDVADLEVGVFGGVAAEDDLVLAAGLQALDLHAVVLALLFEKGAVVGDGGVIERGRVIIVRPTAVEHELDRDEGRRPR